MKLSQKNIVRITLAAFVVLYNFVLFMVTSHAEKLPVFWISYGFIMLAPLIFLLLTAFPLSFTGGTNLVLSLPVYRAMTAYFAIEFLVGTLFMIIQKHASVKAALLVQVPLLLVFAIVFFVYLLGATHISNGYAKQKSDVFSLNQMQMSVNHIAASTAYPHVASRLRLIAEKIKYSDFNSYPETKEIEAEIQITLNELRFSESDESKAYDLTSRLDLLVDQRRETCKAIKKMRG